MKKFEVTHAVITS